MNNEPPKTWQEEREEILDPLEERNEEAKRDFDELTAALKRMRQMAAHNYPALKDVK